MRYLKRKPEHLGGQWDDDCGDWWFPGLDCFLDEEDYHELPQAIDDLKLAALLAPDVSASLVRALYIYTHAEQGRDHTLDAMRYCMWATERAPNEQFSRRYLIGVDPAHDSTVLERYAVPGGYYFPGPGEVCRTTMRAMAGVMRVCAHAAMDRNLLLCNYTLAQREELEMPGRRSRASREWSARVRAGVAALPSREPVIYCDHGREHWLVTPGRDCLLPACGCYGTDTSAANPNRPCESCGLAHRAECDKPSLGFERFAR